MTQASDLGGIANQLAAFYRARVNVGFQAVASQHYGASEPPVMYPCMVWFSSGDGYVKIRNPTNTAWETIGTIGPPMKFINVDIPDTAWVTGDVKTTYRVTAPAGWLVMNDGSIGDGSSGAVSRANPDTQALFELLWAVTIDDWCSVYAAGTWTRTGRGASAAADFAAHRHILLPKSLGRVMGQYGAGAGLYGVGLATWHGEQATALGLGNLPSHTHSFSGSLPAHTHVVPLLSGGAAGASGGDRTYPLYGGGVASGAAGGGTISGNTGSAGSGAAHNNMQPTTYVNYMIKL